jgi:predicted ester cyclase
MRTADLSIADEIFAEDFVSHIPGYPQVTDLEAYKQEAASAAAVIPEFSVVVEDLFFAGDRAVGRFTATGLMPPDGVPYVNTWIIVYRFEDGRIAEEWWQFDLLGVQQQLGLIPSTRTSYAWGEPSEVAGDPGDPPHNQSLARRAEQIWNTGNMTLADLVFSADAIGHGPLLPDAGTREDFEEQVVMMRAAFPDLRVTVEEVVAAGDRVAVRRTVTGTQEGTFMGIPATGRSIAFTGNEIYRVADREIVESWWAYDALGLMLQLTASP